MNRIGRRVIMCMLLIAALAIVWNVLGEALTYPIACLARSTSHH